MGSGVGDLIPCSPPPPHSYLAPSLGSAQQTILLICTPSLSFLIRNTLPLTDFIQLSFLHPVSLQTFVEVSGLLLPPFWSFTDNGVRRGRICVLKPGEWVGTQSTTDKTSDLGQVT